MKSNCLIFVSVLSLGVAMPAHAVSISVKRSGSFIDPTHTLLQDFDGATTAPQGSGVTASEIAPVANVNTEGLPNIVSFDMIGGVGRRPGVISGTPTDVNNAFPGLSTGKFLSIKNGESYTLNFEAPLRSLAFSLGSFNSGDNVALTLGDNTVTIFSGTQIVGSAANWGTLSNGYVRYDMDATPGSANTIKSVTFSTAASGKFFEIDNIYGALPEPAMWAMLIGGFGMAGVALRKRRPVVMA